MKWKVEKLIPPEHGETRTVTKFLWFPKEIHKEGRWLEKASWVEKFHTQINDWNPVKWL
jgi:hypothetical protein